MKILACHIENFGKIHDYSMNFRDGANIICEKNGWGKSTLVAFIRAMFYGLEGDRKRSIEENERKKYKPWQGGVFGGQLVFEMQEKKYLISRVFKDKETNDEFELRDAETNLLVKEYTSRIGEEIFKINRTSFLRTIFIEQNNCETSSTDDINAKIGRLADNSNDLNNFEAAAAKLSEILSKLNPKRSTGTISKRREDIALYERVVQGGREIAASIEQYQERLQAEEAVYEELKGQMKEAAETQKKVSRQQAEMAKRAEWTRLRRTADRRLEEQRINAQKFPGNIPTLEDVKEKILECGDMDRACDKAAMYHVTQAEKEELALLENTFAQGTPSDADFDRVLSDAKAFKNISQAYASEQISAAEKKRLDELEPYFSKEGESAASVVGNWNKRNTIKAALPSKQAALMALRASMESQKSGSPKKLPLFLFLAIGIVLVIAGVSVAAAVSPALGIIVALVGAGFAAAGILSDRKAEPVQPAVSPEFENLRQTIAEDEEYIAKTDGKTAAYLMAYGRSFHEDTVSGVLQEIVEESIEYSSLKKKYEKSLDRTKEMEVEIESLRQSVMAFFGRYGIVSVDSNVIDDLYLLKEKAKKYRVLKEKQTHLRKAEEDYEALRARILLFLNEHSYEVSDNISAQLSDIQDCVLNYRNSVKDLRDAREELAQFEAANQISELREIKTEESLPTLEELNRQIQWLTEERESAQKNINSYSKTLDDLQEEYDEWEGNCTRLEELKSIQSIEEKKYEYVSMAKKKLEQAKEIMTAKYADPIFQGFGQYYEMISGDEAARFHIDANTTVTVDELGKQRDTNTLSSGYKDLIGICLRIALVDVMYQEEKPPLIMDDPFTNLDDKKINAGRAFIEKLAEKYQIIYFTCSASRG